MTEDAPPALADPVPLQRAREVLRERFGLQDFRLGQDQAVARVLSGEDMTIVMPTGAGKSACFQVPALVRPGLTLVISPLIALMKDQVEALRARGIAAEVVNSTVPAAEQWRRLDAVAAGRVQLLYVAPERLTAPSFLRAMERSSLTMVAIDEAHCISQWGHDFRPAYLGIRDFLSRHAVATGRRPQVIALTATATPRVRADIAAQLDLDPHRALVTGFRRENLRLLSRRCDRKGDRAEQALRIIKGVGGAGIVYCSTRKDVEEVQGELAAGGVSCAAYHAGLPDAVRSSVQEAFITGTVPVIVATNAFGMGIDKADLRFVVHHSLPGSIEAYYQEAGRAGRDGKISYCVLLHGSADRHLHEFFIEGSCPPDASVKAVLEELRRGKASEPIERGIDDIAAGAGVPEIQCGGALRMLEDAGLIERLDDRDNPAHVTLLGSPRDVAARLPTGTQRRALVDWLVERFAPAEGQAVAVRPSAVESDLGMARETLLRVLRELSEARVAEVKVPFRGRGIVLTQASASSADVKVALAPQFAAAAARRERASERLDRVQHYAHQRGCRHGFLLRYFGDTTSFECRACDNCCGWHESPSTARADELPLRERKRTERRERKAAKRSAAIDFAEAAPLALRAVGDLRRRFGMGMARLVLRGSQSKKVLAARLEGSAAYAGLARLSEAQVDEVLTWLEAEGLVETSTGPYPTVSLTEEGELRLAARGDWTP